MKSFFPFLLVLLVLVACKSTSNLNGEEAGGEKKIIPQGLIIAGFNSPESVLLTRSNMFVSNVGLELAPKSEDLDGYISKLSTSGEMQMERFITDLNAPKGMAEINGTIYVADIDKVKAFKSESGELIQTYEFLSYGASFLNDITAKSASELLISDTDLNLIFTLNVRSGEVGKIPLPDNFVGVNGLYCDPLTDITFLVGFGSNGEGNGRVAIMYPSDDPNGSPGPIEVLETPTGSYDGVVFIESKYIVFSDWGNGEGRLRYYDINTKETWLMNLENSIGGPADFAFDALNKCLWIPGMQDGMIYQEFLDFY